MHMCARNATISLALGQLPTEGSRSFSLSGHVWRMSTTPTRVKYGLKIKSLVAIRLTHILITVLGN